MRILLQRVSHAQVAIAGAVHSEIGAGFLLTSVWYRRGRWSGRYSLFVQENRPDSPFQRSRRGDEPFLAGSRRLAYGSESIYSLCQY